MTTDIFVLIMYTFQTLDYRKPNHPEASAESKRPGDTSISIFQNINTAYLHTLRGFRAVCAVRSFVVCSALVDRHGHGNGDGGAGVPSLPIPHSKHLWQEQHAQYSHRGDKNEPGPQKVLLKARSRKYRRGNVERMLSRQTYLQRCCSPRLS